MSRPLSNAVAFADAALERWARWGRLALNGWPDRTLLARVMEEGFTGAAHESAPLPAMDDTVEATERAVLSLSTIERKVVLSFYGHERPVEVSATDCEVSIEQFRHTLSRARQRVAWYLQGWIAMSDREPRGITTVYHDNRAV